MIRTINIELNAASPTLPLCVMDTFVGSPSQIRILNVPRRVGLWRITDVYIVVKYPDNTVRSVNCVNAYGVWSGTVPGCDVPGFAAKGYQVCADGVDEFGVAVTGYILGVGDVFVVPCDGAIMPGEVAYRLMLRDDVPTAPRKGDVAVVGGVLKWYAGSLWQGFDNPAALQLTPVYSQTPTYGDDWTYDGLGEGITVAKSPEFHEASGPIPAYWDMEIFDGTQGFVLEDYDSGSTASTLHFGDITATRARTDIIGYTLGNQTTKPLQPQGEYATTAQLAGAVRYDLPANATVITSASSEVVEGETVTYGEATLADRTANRVEVTAAIAELRLTFPATVSGKVRDFGLRVKVGTGSAALTAPALVPPAGVTLENSAVAALADGAATAAGVTLLYFSETAPGVFLVKGEQVKEA